MKPMRNNAGIVLIIGLVMGYILSSLSHMEREQRRRRNEAFIQDALRDMP